MLEQLVEFGDAPVGHLLQLDLGAVLVVRAGVARLLQLAQVVLMAKNNVHGVYSADPRTHADAEFIPEITHKEALTRGLQVMDSTAFALCMDNNLPIVVFNMADERNIDKIVSGERVGTLVRT